MDPVYAGTQTLLQAPLADALTPGDSCAELSLVEKKPKSATPPNVSRLPSRLATMLALEVPLGQGYLLGPPAPPASD